jgi:hypothetical protein
MHKFFLFVHLSGGGLCTPFDQMRLLPMMSLPTPIYQYSSGPTLTPLHLCPHLTSPPLFAFTTPCLSPLPSHACPSFPPLSSPLVCAGLPVVDPCDECWFQRCSCRQSGQVCVHPLVLHCSPQALMQSRWKVWSQGSVRQRPPTPVPLSLKSSRHTTTNTSTRTREQSSGAPKQ